MSDENLNQNENGSSASQAPGTGENATQSDWFESLPEDLRGNESVVTAWKGKTPADLLKAQMASEDRLKSALVVPGENATSEERKAFEFQMRKALGVPDAPEGYQLKLPEGIPATDPLLAAMVKGSHVHGLNSQQLQGVIDTYLSSIGDLRTAQQVEGKKALETLWKVDFQQNLDTAFRGIKGAAIDAGIPQQDVESVLDQTGWGDHPVLVRIFAAVGKHYVEDSFKGAGGGSPPEMERTLSGQPMLEYPNSPNMKR